MDSNYNSNQQRYPSFEDNESKISKPSHFENIQNEENIDCAAPIFAAPAKTQDKYLETTEAKYHNVDNMIYSDKVLRNEKEICEEIIKFKKENNYDYNLWSKKLVKIDDYLFLDLNKEKNTSKYKTAIDNQMRKEKDLLFEMEVDSNLKEYEIPCVKERIIKRILIVRKELEELNNLPEQSINKTEQNKPQPIIQKQIYPPVQSESPLKNQKTNIQTNNPPGKVSNPPIVIKQANINQNLLSYANTRLNEYRDVSFFFRTNQLFNEENDALYKMKTINLLIAKIKHGDKTVNESSFPPSITKEYIYGCNPQKRDETINFLINEIRTQIGIIEEEKEIIIRRFYNSTKNGVKMPKELIEDNEALIEEKMKILKQLKEILPIEWIRPPTYFTREVTVARLKKNYKVVANCLVANITVTNVHESNLYYFIKISEVKGETEKVFPAIMNKKSFQWGFELPIYNKLYNQELSIFFYQKQ